MCWSQFSPYDANWWEWTMTQVDGGQNGWQAQPSFISDGLQKGLPCIATQEDMALRFSNSRARKEEWFWAVCQYKATGFCWYVSVVVSNILILITYLLFISLRCKLCKFKYGPDAPPAGKLRNRFRQPQRPSINLCVMRPGHWFG